MVGGKSLGERTFNLSTIIIMVILMAVTIYPFWFSLISSLNSGEDLLRGQSSYGRENGHGPAGKRC